MQGDTQRMEVEGWKLRDRDHSTRTVSSVSSEVSRVEESVSQW